MKELTIISNTQAPYFDKGIVIDVPRERWGFSLNSKESDGTTQRECVEIGFTLPDGKRWTGTITDFSAIFSIVRNVLNELADLEEEGFISTDAIEELQHLLSHLK